jgi:NAD(P)-dependent dehydrogenase (short-subunit alcohol dehydrogenase family)
LAWKPPAFFRKQVVVGAGDVEKAEANLAVAGIPNTEDLPLDFASANSIDRFADAFLKSNRRLGILIHNAGLSEPPLTRGERGYEIQFVTNHLGHFQPTASLWNALKTSGDGRVVTYSSIGHNVAGVDFSDPNSSSGRMTREAAFGQAKTATSPFAVEFYKRAQAHCVRAFAVPPGSVPTDLLRYTSHGELQVWGIYRKMAHLKPGRLQDP